MSGLAFATNEYPTLGVELELMLVDERTADLKASAVSVLQAAAPTHLGDRIKLEITESMIEITSSVHHRHDVLRTELMQIGRGLVAACRSQGVQVCAGGTHPFHRWQESNVSPGERFQAVGQLYGYLAKQFTVFGQHIHVGCRDGEDAVRAIHFLSLFVPHFIATAASSPFYRGIDTGFDSCRLNVVAAFPLSGRMPQFETWAQFLAFFERLRTLGIAASIKDLYWDIRPQPDFGTVELRVPDTPLDVLTAADLAAYAQVLVQWSRSHEAWTWIDDYVYRHNRFQAARFGFDGQIVVSPGGERCSIADHLSQTVERCVDIARELHCEAALRRLADLAASKCNGARWLRERFADRGSLVPVVHSCSARWCESLTSQRGC
ncbi:MAG TPA: YbdK family carboxylate-amine ligase [Steroidobacteraceae bacterium]|nr:YbdK family carboxylate-amine ligase [Steroidobacteraceae bacterium]